MKTTIFCRTIDKGLHAFYMNHEGQTHFLFTQKYRKGVNNYYRRGVTLDEAINFAKAHKDDAITRTMVKLPSYIKYIEKEYEVIVLNKTKMKNKTTYPKKRSCA